MRSHGRSGEGSTVLGQTPQTFRYDAVGNLLSKTGVGTGDYEYPAQGTGAVRPHGVKRIPGIGDFLYDDNGNLTSGAGRSITWTSFDMPLKITGAGPSATFVYGPEHQRTRQTRGDGSSVVYAGAQEVEKNSSGTTVKTYWPGGIGVEIDRPNATVSELYWHHVDRLGSMIGLTDQAGVLTEKLAYDSWGKRRSIDGSSTPNTLDGQVDNRGFTGHEMLDQLDLVHMNGRVYDPLVARFVSGDPILQDPVDGQNYNRYSYVLNNPTNNTDPTGFQTMTGTRLENVDTGAGCSGGCDFPLMRKRYNLNGADQPAEGRKKEVGGKIDPKAGGNATQNAGETSAITPTRTLRVDAQKEFNRPGRVELLNSYNDSLELGINVISFAEGGIGLARAALGLWAKFMPSLARSADDAALAGGKQVQPGEFSIFDWTGYPAGVPKPNGPFRLLGGEEYQAARQAANAANKELRMDIQHVGQFDIHEITPVKFNGSPTSIDNKVIMDRSLHRQQVTPWWNALQKALERVPSP